jgi:seryl-tRNA synthetase
MSLNNLGNRLGAVGRREEASFAAPPADLQLCVQLLERACPELRQPRQRRVADRGLDELLDRHPVARPGGLLNLMASQPLIEQIAQRHTRARRRASEVYRLAGDDLYLVGTSEVALAGYHSNEILADVPRRYAGFSSCFRREAGSYGKDTKGIIRVHWFDKVEMFSYVNVEDARDEHRRLLAWEKTFLDKLELAYRVVDIAAGDLGVSAARKFDIEAWFPSQGTYRELTSTSNCTTFQSRRLNIRTRSASGTVPVATLNGTLRAVARTIACLLDHHQQPDGSVYVPASLRPWLGGREVLTPHD